MGFELAETTIFTNLIANPLARASLDGPQMVPRWSLNGFPMIAHEALIVSGDGFKGAKNTQQWVDVSQQ